MNGETGTARSAPFLFRIRHCQPDTVFPIGFQVEFLSAETEAFFSLLHWYFVMIGNLRIEFQDIYRDVDAIVFQAMVYEFLFPCSHRSTAQKDHPIILDRGGFFTRCYGGGFFIGGMDAAHAYGPFVRPIKQPDNDSGHNHEYKDAQPSVFGPFFHN